MIPSTSRLSLATPCTYPLCHSSAPVIPCTCPLSSLASLCHHLYTHCHPKSSPVISCTCLCHPSLPPSSSTRSLAARWSVVLTIHNHFSCHKSRNLNHPSVNLYARYWWTLICILLYIIRYNNAPVVCISLQFMHLHNTCIYSNFVSLSFFLDCIFLYIH